MSNIQITIEEEIELILNKILQGVVIIDRGDFSQQVKDESKRILSKSIDMTNEMLSSVTIDKIVYDEWRKKQNAKLMADN